MTIQDVQNIKDVATAALKAGLYQQLGDAVTIHNSVAAIELALAELEGLRSRVDELQSRASSLRMELENSKK